jgi:GT2 family glycosyltransferase
VPLPVSIVIPTWNGRHLLERFLPSVISCARGYGNAEILIVDDGSSDGTHEWLARLAATSDVHVRVVRHATNLGFGAAANRGIREAAHPFVWLLNNDVDVATGSLAPLADAFADDPPKLLAVHSTMVDLATGEAVGTGKMGGFSRGFLRVHRSYIPRPGARGPFPSIFATGGSAMFRRSLFLELGGFDAIFAPFYMEDVELCYRAWKRGYDVRYEPRSIVRHQFSSTIAARAGGRVERISQRNRLLFHWIHLHDRAFLGAHVFWLLVLLASAPLTMKFEFAGAWFDAIRRWPDARARRRVERAAASRADRDVLELFRELDGSGEVRSYGEKREVDLAAFLDGVRSFIQDLTPKIRSDPENKKGPR